MDFSDYIYRDDFAMSGEEYSEESGQVDENIPDNVIKEIAKRQPLRAVFRDSSFANSPAKINVGEIFKLLTPDTRVKVL